MKQTPRRILVTLLKLAVGAGVITYVIWSRRVDFGELGEAFRRDIGLIVAAFAVLLAVPLVGLIRWLVIVRLHGIRLGVYEAFRIHMIGVFFNAFLLGTMGGDLLKAYYVATGAGSRKKAASVTTIFLDRILGALAFLVVAGCGLLLSWRTLPWNPRFKMVLAAVGAIAAGWLTATVLLFLPWLRERRRRWLERFTGRETLGGKVARALNDMDEAMQEALRHPRASLFCIAISLAGHLANAVAFNLFGVALGMRGVPFTHYVALGPIALLGAALPLPGGALGAAELFASIVFHSGAEAAKWVGGTIVILWRIGLFVPGPLGFVYFVFHRKEVRLARAAARDIAAKEGSRPEERGGEDQVAGGRDA